MEKQAHESRVVSIQCMVRPNPTPQPSLTHQQPPIGSPSLGLDTTAAFAAKFKSWSKPFPVYTTLGDLCPCNIQTQASWTKKNATQENWTKISHCCWNKVASFGLEHQVAGKATRISSCSWNLDSADVASIFSGPLSLRLNWDERSGE